MDIQSTSGGENAVHRRNAPNKFVRGVMFNRLMAVKTDATTLSSAQGSANDDVAALTFEQAREELSQVVARLEAGGEPLEGALALWERGEALAAHCQVWLDGARARFEAITGDSDGSGPKASSFDPEPF